MALIVGQFDGPTNLNKTPIQDKYDPPHLRPRMYGGGPNLGPPPAIQSLVELPRDPLGPHTELDRRVKVLSRAFLDPWSMHAQ